MSTNVSKSNAATSGVLYSNSQTTDSQYNNHDQQTRKNLVWIWDPDQMRIIWANTAALTFWGETELHNILDKTFDPRSEVVDTLNNTFLNIRGTTQEQHISITVAPCGLPVRLSCTIRICQIHSQREGLHICSEVLENGAQAETDRLYEILNHNPYAISLFGEDGHILWQNATADYLFKTTNEHYTLTDRYENEDIASIALRATLINGYYSHCLHIKTCFGKRCYRVDLRRINECVTGGFAAVMFLRDVTEYASISSNKDQVSDTDSPVLPVVEQEPDIDNNILMPTGINGKHYAHNVANVSKNGQQFAIDKDTATPDILTNYTGLLDHLDTGVVLVDANMSIIYMNTAGRDILDLAVHTTSTHKGFDVLDSVQYQILHQAVTQLIGMAHEQQHTLTRTLTLRLERNLRTLENQKNNIHTTTTSSSRRIEAVIKNNVHADPRFVLVSLVDVTQEHSTRVQEKFHEQEYRRAVNDARTGVVFVNRIGKVLHADAKAIEFLYGKEGNIKEANTLLFWDLLAQNAFTDNLRASFADGTAFTYENAVFETSSSSSAHTVAPLYLRISMPEAHVASPGLRCLVLQQVPTQEKDYLTQAQDLVMHVSHELRTPLGNIMGFVDLLRHEVTTLADKHREYFNDIHESGRYMSRLLDDLIDMRCIHSGNRELSRTYFDLNELCKNILRTTQPVAREQKIILKLQPTSQPFIVHADSDVIQQSINNLVTNAVRYAGEHSTVTIELSEQMQFIRIHDNGIGMTSGEIRKALEVFGQVARPGSFKRGGGLGLPLAKQLIELHGWTFALKSAPQRGTEILVRIQNG